MSEKMETTTDLTRGVADMKAQGYCAEPDAHALPLAATSDKIKIPLPAWLGPDTPENRERLQASVEGRATSEAKQQEPVAWPSVADAGMLRAMVGWRCSDQRDGLTGEAAMMDQAYHALYEHMRDRGYTAPPALDREAVAKIIGGDIFGSPDDAVGPATRAARTSALAKADAILSLIGGA